MIKQTKTIRNIASDKIVYAYEIFKYIFLERLSDQGFLQNSIYKIIVYNNYFNFEYETSSRLKLTHIQSITKL